MVVLRGWSWGGGELEETACEWGEIMVDSGAAEWPAANYGIGGDTKPVFGSEAMV